MQPLFESLETRSLFSVSPVITGPPAEPALASSFAIAPLVALKKMVGTWKGTVNVVGVHSRPVTVVISKQTSTGRITGTLTTPLDSSIVVAFSGKVKANGRVSISLLGGHSGGAINGTGSGKLKAAGKSISFTMIFTQGGQSFPGSLTLKKV